MLLRALKDIPTCINPIRAGEQFHEVNPLQAQEWIGGKYAEPVATLSQRNSRGWDGLYWDGATVVIIASGPSLTAEQCERVRAWREAGDKRKAVVINTSFRMAPWADILYACDMRWWDCVENGKTHFEEARESFDLAQMWTTEEPAAKKYGIRHIRSVRLPGLGKTPGLIHQGNNGGYQTVNLAYQAGAKRLVLLGFDMHETGGKAHHHADHPGIRTINNYAEWLAAFEVVAPELKAEGVEVANATPGSALKCFERMGLARALRENEKVKEENGSIRNTAGVAAPAGQEGHSGGKGQVAVVDRHCAENQEADS